MSVSYLFNRKYKKIVLFPILVFLLIGFLFAQSGEKQVDSNRVEITYVGNSGVIISAMGKKVAIDALFTGFKGSYTLPGKTLKAISKARAPFDRIDLVLHTHGHGDHLDPQLLGKFLKKAKAAVCVTTGEVTDDIANTVYGYDKFKTRLTGPALKKGESKKLELKGIPLEVIHLDHGSRIMQHYGFILELAGKKIFHTGDSSGEPQKVEKELNAFGFPGRKIDIAFLPYWYLNKSKYKRIVREIIDPAKIVAIHLDVRGRGTDKEELINKIKTHYPDAVILTRHLESVTIQ